MNMKLNADIKQTIYSRKAALTTTDSMAIS